jgi:hypothetical protein
MEEAMLVKIVLRLFEINRDHTTVVLVHMVENLM